MDSLIYSTISFLLAGNIWFVRRLVLKIDKMDETVTSRLPVQQGEIKTMTNKVEALEVEIKSLSNEIKNFGSIRERIAVIEALFGRSKIQKRITK